MLERVNGKITIEGNVEDILGGINGVTRIARISQTCVLTGGLEGESIAEYTAVLPRGGDGSFQGFQRISATLGERAGTFVISVDGDYHKSQPRGNWSIVPKSGSGDFVHIRGSGTFILPGNKPGTYRLEFELRKPRRARQSSETDAAVAVDTLETEVSTPPVVADESVQAPPKPVRQSRPRKPRAPITAVEQAASDGTPLPSETAPVQQPKRRARTGKPPSEQAAVQPDPVLETPVKRGRSKKAAPVEIVEVAPVSNTKRTPAIAKRTTPAKVVGTTSVEDQQAPVEPKRTCRKAAAPMEPTVLGVVESEPTPVRPRRVKAA